MAAIAPDVSLFSCNSLALKFSVNNGTEIVFPATSANLGWAPTSPPTKPGWSAQPSPGNLAPGPNAFVVTPVAVNQPYQFVATLPNSVNWTSVQLYFYWNTSVAVSWLALNNGQAVSGSYIPPIFGSP